MNIVFKILGKIIGAIGFLLIVLSLIFAAALFIIAFIPMLLVGVILCTGVILVCAWDMENFKSNLKEAKESLISENDEEEEL